MLGVRTPLPITRSQRPTARMPAASVVFVCDGDRPTSSSSAWTAGCRRPPSSTSAPRATPACSVNSAAKTAAFLDGGLDPEHLAPIATRSSPSATCSLSSAPLRLPQGGDQPNLITIDNGIASYGIVVPTPVHHHRNHRTLRAGLTVRFPPFPLYEITVMRSPRPPRPPPTACRARTRVHQLSNQPQALKSASVG